MKTDEKNAQTAQTTTPKTVWHNTWWGKTLLTATGVAVGVGAKVLIDKTKK